MKKFYLLALSILMISAARAQFSHTALLYGNIRYYNVNNTVEGNNTRNRSFSVMPGAGYQFSEHMAIGAAASFGVGRSTNINVVNTTTDFKVGPFVRYTQFLTDHFFVFAQVSGNYLTTKETVESNIGTSSYFSNGFSTDLFPAMGIHFNRGLSLNFSVGGLGYQMYKNDDRNIKNNSFLVSFGQELQIGVSKNFGLKRPPRGNHGLMDDTRVIDTTDDETEEE